MTRRWWHIITGSLVPGWLLAAVIVAVASSRIPDAPWLPVHLLLLGAVSTAILIWSQHFANTLLRRDAPGGRRSLGLRLAAHTLGTFLIVVGVPCQLWIVMLVGGNLVGVNAIGHAAVLLVQSRGSLPARFAPLVRYYMVAGLALAVGVTMGILMARPDSTGEAHERLFITHLAMNVLGWIGLTVIGAGLVWFAIGTAAFGVDLAVGPTFMAAAERVDGVIPVVVVGFAAQIVIGALSYLIPVVLGGGPHAAKATAAELDRAGFLRALLLNLCLVVYLLPVPDAVRAMFAALVGIIAVAFLVLMARAMRANARSIGT